MITESDARQWLHCFEGIEGMMTRLAGASFLAILGRQRAENVGGPLLEFGVYKGRSAFLLERLRAAGSPLDLVDIRVTSEVRDRFDALPGVAIHEMRSAAFHARLELEDPRRRYGVIHVDGNHTFDNVTEDLKFAEQYLARDGVCILDDYQNPHFPQVPAATFHHLYTKASRLRVFAIGANKAFLCDAERHEGWLQYLLDGSAADMGRLGEEVRLSKSDFNPAFDVVGFANCEPGAERIYGPKLYAHLYEPARREGLLARATVQARQQQRPPLRRAGFVRRLLGR